MCLSECLQQTHFNNFDNSVYSFKTKMRKTITSTRWYSTITKCGKCSWYMKLEAERCKREAEVAKKLQMQIVLLKIKRCYEECLTNSNCWSNHTSSSFHFISIHWTIPVKTKKFTYYRINCFIVIPFYIRTLLTFSQYVGGVIQIERTENKTTTTTTI